MKDKKIYITNNQKNIINLLEFIFLSKGGYEIKSFSNCTELAKNLYCNPDVLVMDETSISSMNSMENIKECKIPIIVLLEKNKPGINGNENKQIKFIQQKDFFIDDLVETVEKSTK